MKQDNLENLQKEFGKRLVQLSGGIWGIRGGIHTVSKALTGELPIVRFIASDDTLDRYDETIDQRGWELDDFEKNPVIPDCHRYDSIACILGKAVRCEVINNRLEDDVLFALDNPLGSMAYKMAVADFIRTQSVGFMPKIWVNGSTDKDPSRRYTRQSLLEISLTVVPANPNASNVLLAYKSGALDKSDIREAYQLLKSICGDKAESKPDATETGSGVDGSELLRMLGDTAKAMRL